MCGPDGTASKWNLTVCGRLAPIPLTKLQLTFKFDQNIFPYIFSNIHLITMKFAHTKTAQLSWYVQSFIVIGWLLFKLQQQQFHQICKFGFRRSLVGPEPEQPVTWSAGWPGLVGRWKSWASAIYNYHMQGHWLRFAELFIGRQITC